MVAIVFFVVMFACLVSLAIKLAQEDGFPFM